MRKGSNYCVSARDRETWWRWCLIWALTFPEKHSQPEMILQWGVLRNKYPNYPFLPLVSFPYSPNLTGSHGTLGNDMIHIRHPSGAQSRLEKYGKNIWTGKQMVSETITFVCVWKNMVEDFPNLLKDTNRQTQEAQWTLNRTNSKKYKPRYIIIKLLKN